MPLPKALPRYFRGSVVLISLSGFTFAMVLALVVSTRSGQEAVANEATLNQVTTVRICDCCVRCGCFYMFKAVVIVILSVSGSTCVEISYSNGSVAIAVVFRCDFEHKRWRGRSVGRGR
jgi:hypothetical protein